MKNVCAVGLTGWIVFIGLPLYAPGFSASEFDWWSSVFTGTVSSLVASGLFLAFLSFMKPRIRVSDEIVKRRVRARIYEDDMDESERSWAINEDWLSEHGKRYIVKEKLVYQFKVINRTLWSIFDVHYCLKFIVPSYDGKGRKCLGVVLMDLQPISSVHTIPRFRFQDQKGKSGAEYAVRLTTENNLEQFWKSENAKKRNTEPYIELEITARHGFSGFPIIRKQHYTEIECIREGKFISGNTMKIKKCG